MRTLILKLIAAVQSDINDIKNNPALKADLKALATEAVTDAQNLIKSLSVNVWTELGTIVLNEILAAL